jgi:hypothetical protein
MNTSHHENVRGRVRHYSCVYAVVDYMIHTVASILHMGRSEGKPKPFPTRNVCRRTNRESHNKNAARNASLVAASAVGPRYYLLGIWMADADIFLTGGKSCTRTRSLSHGRLNISICSTDHGQQPSRKCHRWGYGNSSNSGETNHTFIRVW